MTIQADHRLTLGPEPAQAAAVAVFMHGRGGSPSDMGEFAAALALPRVRFIMPAAPDRSWYPQSFLAPIEANEPKLSASLQRYAQIVDELIAAGIGPERIVLGGFSQGACLTAEFLVRHPRRYGAALILTGGLIGPPGTAWPTPAALAGVPVYLSGSEIDEWVPIARAEETRAVLAASGAALSTRFFEDRPHLVSGEEVAGARALLAGAVQTTA